MYYMGHNGSITDFVKLTLYAVFKYFWNLLLINILNNFCCHMQSLFQIINVNFIRTFLTVFHFNQKMTA